VYNIGPFLVKKWPFLGIFWPKKAIFGHFLVKKGHFWAIFRHLASKENAKKGLFFGHF